MFEYEQKLRAFLAGSDENNRMRREIDVVAKTVASCFCLSDFKDKRMEELHLTSDEVCKWRFSENIWRNDGGPKGEVILTCRIAPEGGSLQNVYSTDGRVPLWMKNVGKVHSTLSVFLGAVEQEYPFMKERLAPYYELGEAALLKGTR